MEGDGEGLLVEDYVHVWLTGISISLEIIFTSFGLLLFRIEFLECE